MENKHFKLKAVKTLIKRVILQFLLKSSRYYVCVYALFNDDIIRYFVPEVIEEKLMMVIKEIEDVRFLFQ